MLKYLFPFLSQFKVLLLPCLRYVEKMAQSRPLTMKIARDSRNPAVILTGILAAKLLPLFLTN